MTSTDQGPNYMRLVAPYRGAETRRSIIQVVTSVALFIFSWWLTYQSLQVGYWLTLLLALPTAGLLVRLFVICHDCAHSSFFKQEWANRLVGRVLGVPTLTPFRFWQRSHIQHHATSGNLSRRGTGDVDTMTLREYSEQGPWGRFQYRFARHPAAFLTLGPIYLFILKHRIPYDMPFSRRREWMSVILNNIVLVALIWGMSEWIGLGSFLAVHIPVFLFSSAGGIWLFYVQHQYPGTYWEADPEWNFAEASFRGSSYYDLPQPLRFFTADIGVHHIHHLCSAIPNYKLKRCMDEVKELPQPVRLTLASSLRCANLSLWDEERKQLIPMRDAKAALAGAR